MGSSLLLKTTVIPTVQERLLGEGVRELVKELCDEFEKRRIELMDQRAVHRAAMADGQIGLNEQTTHIRNAEWTVDAIPDHLQERRVELLGGATRSELIEGLNAGAKTYIADLWNFTPGDTWNILRAHRSLERASKLQLAYMSPDGGRVRVNPKSTTRLMIVPRPMYVMETALSYGDAPVAATFFDLALIILNSGRNLIEHSGGIHLVLRDVQTHLEARWWARLFDHLEEHLEVPRGTIRATVMIDSIPAALEVDEILFELSHHAAGVTIDPQGYAADHIALFSGKDRSVLPDRETIGLNAPFLRALSLRIIGIAHRRGCHAIGAPSFVLPPLDPEKLKGTYLEMLADKEREAVDGYDGTIVVHAGTVNAAMVEFNKSMPRANQLYYQRRDEIPPSDLVRRPEGEITVESLVGMIRTALRSMVQLGEGRGWVIQGGRMHDRSSLRLTVRLLWQWNHSNKGIITASGLDVHDDLLRYLVKKECDKMFGDTSEKIQKLAKRCSGELLDSILADQFPPEPKV
jgi:malate synthase